KRPDGSVVSGPSPSDLVRAKSPEADTRTRAALDATMQQMDAIVKRAVGGEAYDQMLGEGNEAGNSLLDQTIQALIAQSKEFERDIAALELKSIQFEGSDSLDNPTTVR
ncbi:MAG: imelysin family protein, partial [Hyphomicrobium sp.]|nr:imelysin family protein [Hyphomicrobium sp.]